ncbi:uncharacterized protein LOC128896137 [Hylaeus anthracinus]|uniref:uncharacterized protein LOC128896137 n=1 Tax=Hylaeus anthracinus TaxID=313031 RepID=UPI0023B90B9E|nr:uncharacterized protein LOC128896137 [Hylaeus anthracinus]
MAIPIACPLAAVLKSENLNRRKVLTLRVCVWHQCKPVRGPSPSRNPFPFHRPQPREKDVSIEQSVEQSTPRFKNWRERESVFRTNGKRQVNAVQDGGFRSLRQCTL